MSSSPFENCYLIQYSIDSNKKIVPLWKGKITKIKSKLIEDLHFYGVQSSKFGVRKIKLATHFAIIDITKTGKDMFLFNSEISREPEKQRSYHSVNGHFLVLKGTKHYYDIVISESRTVKQAKKNLEFKKGTNS